jgi:tetratricopeptide (TPR) repeat protein
MRTRQPRPTTLAIAIGLFALAASGSIAQTMPFAPPPDPTSVPNPNRDAQEVTQLLRAGRIDAANVRVDAMLAKNPKDAQARFLKGLVLTDQGKSADAIQAFRTLTEDHPELPEPYNNLASLYAAAGQFDKARIALESAVAANPSYAIAYDNLGDLYMRMAAQAYDKVLQLDRTNAATRTKSAAVRTAIDAAKLPGR